MLKIEKNYRKSSYVKREVYAFDLKYNQIDYFPSAIGAGKKYDTSDKVIYQYIKNREAYRGKVFFSYQREFTPKPIFYY